MLSVTAKPFHPVSCWEKEIDDVICNDIGLPALKFVGRNGISSMFRSQMMTDEVIEDVYPPSAQDAAELEAVEAFVNTMAKLALLEDREERTRSVLISGKCGNEMVGDILLEKRWHARKELVSKPRPAKHSVTPVVHGVGTAVIAPDDGSASSSSYSSIVPVQSASLRRSVKDHKTHQREMEKMQRNSMSSSFRKSANRHQKKSNGSVPVHQPRKFT